MKIVLKNQKGVTLISLTTSVVVIIILTSILLNSMRENLGITKLKNMEADIQNLRDKISTFYSNYGKIPAKREYTNIDMLQISKVISDAIDTGKFYVIDLSAIDNLTLSYGQDYKKITDDMTDNEINQLEDLYIINETSHNIFYAKGIEYDGQIFCTDYNSEEVKEGKVKLRYVDNIKVPEGYTYISGNKHTGIKIKNDATAKIYTWVVVEENIKELPEGIVSESVTDGEFIDSVNLFKGYYKNDENAAICITVEEKWSPIYDKKVKYVDKNGDIAIIPAGFSVSKTKGGDTIQDGLVIRDEEGNEFVWVPVSKENFETEFVREHFGTEERKWWKGTFVTDQISADNMYEPVADGLTVDETASESQQEVQKMYKSVRDNGGFYIGRYETGTTKKGSGIRGETLVQKDTEIYNNIGWNNNSDATDETGGAVEVARGFSDLKGYTDVRSTLCYGVQWDAILRWISKDRLLRENLIDSTAVGNLENATIVRPGTVDEYQMKNIYDMAGNVWEWTMEAYATNKNNHLRINRGNSYDLGSINSKSITDREYLIAPASKAAYVGFRIALYIE